MRVKNEQDIEELAQKDLLASASEGFEDYCVDRIIRGAYKHERVFNAVTGNYLNLNDCEQLWQACSLHHTKKMQEKDAEIEMLKKENREMREALAKTRKELVTALNFLQSMGWQYCDVEEPEFQCQYSLSETIFRLHNINLSETPNSSKEGVK